MYSFRRMVRIMRMDCLILDASFGRNVAFNVHKSDV